MKTAAVKRQRKVLIRTQPHDSDPDEDELLGPPANISIPGGHSDDSIALSSFPQEMMTYKCVICNSNGQQ